MKHIREIKPLCPDFNAIMTCLVIMTLIGILLVIQKWLNMTVCIVFCIFYTINLISVAISQLLMRNWRLIIGKDEVAFCNIFGKSKCFARGSVKWKLIGSKMYDRYYIILRDDANRFITHLRPYWRNAYYAFTLKHDGKYSDYEREYLKFLGLKIDISGSVILTNSYS